jgi:beta-lactamase class A
MKRAALLLSLAVSPPLLAQPAPTKLDLLWRRMETRVDQVIAAHDGAMGVAIVDLTDGRTLARNADLVFPTASSIKLPLLLELYRQEERGRRGASGVARLADAYVFDPKDLVDDSRVMAGLTPGVTRLTNRDLAQFVVAVSDNAATNVLIKRVGMERVNAMLKELGLSEIKLRRKMIDLQAAKRGEENVATPRQMAELLRLLHAGKLLDVTLTKDFVALLSTTKDSPIPKLLPPDVTVADKPGELDAVRTDSGIVYAKNRPFAISVMTSYDRDERASERSISEVALAAYRYFEMAGRATEYGRVIGP